LLALRPGQFFAASSDLVNVGEDLPAIEQRYPSIRVPVGILFGKNDQILGYAQHGVAMQSKIPGLVLSLVDGGHMLPFSAPELTARWIAEFVNSRGSSISAG
jgi:pimeloyl-ACP methyl ester carboxylesterase